MLKNSKPKSENVVEAHRVAVNPAVADMAHPAWNKARAILITRYWSGQEAPPARHAEARLVWSAEALSVRFICRQAEPLVLSESPQTREKTIGLWERDVCEIFVAPELDEPERYLEFEAAPTGEWLDLAIHVMPDRRETNWRFSSGMTVAARTSEGQVMITMRVPWKAFGRVPQAGERWRANLFRCVGTGPQRGYLAWQPTRTPQPNYHVPEAFGWLAFNDE
jgi:hypothetical protein